MKQLIARIDEDLHARLKRRARIERRSLNSLVREILSGAVEGDDPGAWLDARIDELGLRSVPPDPGPVPAREDVIKRAAGTKGAVSRALEADRKHSW